MNNDLLNVSLNQGKSFKKKKGKEGFSNNTTNNQNNSNNISELEDQYKLLTQEYNNNLNLLTKDSLDKLSTSNSTSNLYANKFVSFNNAKGYVTNKGTFKWISEDSILDSLSGKNGCPLKQDIVKISENANGYNIPGTNIGSLLVGTPMETSQSCGNEGSNVFVSSTIDNSNSLYKGCFANNTNSSLMQLDGTYNYEQCKNAAIYSGYKYFALQDVDTIASTGKCIVTNDYANATANGNGYKVNKIIPLWSSTTTGTSALLTIMGTLNVLNSDGAAIFSTPNTQKQPSNYIGCYGDNEVRTMIFANNGSQTYNYDTCKQEAVNGNYSLFALQNSTSGTDAECLLSNDLTQSTKYGLANNCTTLSNGIVSGGSWSNALYNTNVSSIDYFLQILDNGNMSIYRGTSPENEVQPQDLIWQTNTSGKSADPKYKASAGKYGRNWIKVNEPLGFGDFVGSPSGSAYLIMQQDGNLVLYTSEMDLSCVKMNDGNMGGGLNGNSLYELSDVGDKSLIGKAAFIDANAELKEYPESMLQYTSDYVLFNGQNNPGNDIASSQVSDIDSCQNLCNANVQCNGIAFQSSTSTCYIKNNNSFPKTDLTMDSSFVTGLRKKKPVSSYCSDQTLNIDSVRYKNYIKGQNMTPDTKCNEPIVNNENKDKLNTIQNQLNELGKKIVTQLKTMSSDKKGNQQAIDANTKKFNNDYRLYGRIMNKINDKNLESNNIEGMQTLKYSDINGVLNNSQLFVNQENYSYILWGILAVGVAAITIKQLSK